VSPMQQQLRSTLVDLRRRLLTPVIAGLVSVEARLDALDTTVAHLARRLDEIEAAIQATGARASAAGERSVQVTESSARIQRRVEEIERLLGAPAAER
jgi:hypothetical protein